jgi:predicted nicotinamide N-methyase
VIDPVAFIRAHTKPAATLLVPQIVLQTTVAIASLQKTLQTLPDGPHAFVPYWAHAWPGGQAMARYILDHPERVAGKSVLDFGAGSGIIAIAAARAGARDVLAADIDPLAVAAIALNAAANAVIVAATSTDLIGQDGGWDTILLGDMFYEPGLTERLLAWLSDKLKHGTQILVGDAGRNCFPQHRMEALQRYSITTSRQLEEADYVMTGVYRLRAG